MTRPIVLIQVSLLFGLAGLLLWRAAVNDVGGFALEIGTAGQQLLKLATEWRFWLGTLVLLGVAVIALELYTNEDLSQIVPMFSIGYIYTAILGQVVLDERVSAQRWLGIGVIIIGVVLVARS